MLLSFQILGFTELDCVRVRATEMLEEIEITSGADAIKKFTPSLGIPYLGVKSKIWEPLVTPKLGNGSLDY